MIVAKINKKKSLKILSFVVFCLIALSYGSPLYAATEISDGSIRALWHLEDTADSSGNGYTLTNTNSVGFTSGILDNAADFGSSNTNKVLTVQSDLGITGGAASWGLWVKMRGEPTNNTSVNLFTQMDAGNKVGYQITYRNTSGTYYVDCSRLVRGVNWFNASYTVTLGTSNWHHILCTYDGTNIRNFTDGSQRAVTSNSGNGSSADYDQSAIGAGYSANSLTAYSSSYIDEMFVTNTALGTTTRESLYNSGSGNEICTEVGCDDEPVATTSTSTCGLSATLDDNFITSYLSFFWSFTLIFFISWLAWKLLRSIFYQFL